MEPDSMFSSKTILDQLLSFISETFVVEKEMIDTEKSLVQTGIIDSIGLIEISDFIESSYKVKVNEAELNRDNFGSVNKIVHFISTKLNQL